MTLAISSIVTEYVFFFLFMWYNVTCLFLIEDFHEFSMLFRFPICFGNHEVFFVKLKLNKDKPIIRIHFSYHNVKTLPNYFRGKCLYVNRHVLRNKIKHYIRPMFSFCTLSKNHVVSQNFYFYVSVFSMTSSLSLPSIWC